MQFRLVCTLDQEQLAGRRLKFYVGSFQASAFSPGVAPADIWNDKWHHVVGTYDGRNARLYLDGVEVGAGTPGVLRINYDLQTSDDFYIGAFRGNCNLGFVGEIDEVWLWQTCLSSDEVRERYAGQPLP